MLATEGGTPTWAMLTTEPMSMSMPIINDGSYPEGHQIGMNGDKSFLKGNGSYQIQEKRLAGTVFTDDETDAGTVVGNPLNVLDERCYLVDSSHLDKVLAGAGNYPGS